MLFKLASLFILFLSKSLNYSWQNLASDYLSDFDYVEQFEIELQSDSTYEITGVKTEFIQQSEFRIYDLDEIEISSISASAFDDCLQNLTVMITNHITALPDELFSTQESVIINFTGSEKQWNEIGYSSSIISEVNYYSNDEGYIHFWNDYVRPTAASDICSFTTEQYLNIVSKYNALSDRDRFFVDSYTDLSGATIKDTIEYINQYYNQTPSRPTDYLSQEQTVELISFIAIFGMTFICVFYFLKQKQYIS